MDLRQRNEGRCGQSSVACKELQRRGGGDKSQREGFKKILCLGGARSESWAFINNSAVRKIINR